MPDLDLRQKAWSAALIVLFFVAWELFCLITGMSDLILPRPSQIFTTLITEQTHHGAEISLLRDLYRNRDTLRST